MKQKERYTKALMDEFEAITIWEDILKYETEEKHFVEFNLYLNDEIRHFNYLKDVICAMSEDESLKLMMKHLHEAINEMQENVIGYKKRIKK